MRRVAAGTLIAAVLALEPAGCGGPGRPVPASSFVIANAMVVDGTGAPGRIELVRVRGSRIAAVGRIQPAPNEPVMDATGLVLAPGFIDADSRAADTLLREPSALGAVSQGVTTVVVGVGGRSPFPLASWLQAVQDTGVAVNVASLVGLGTIRRQIMRGDTARAATGGELDAMHNLLARELGSGALGLSADLARGAGHYAPTDEVIALGRTAAARGGLYAIRLRSSERHLFEALDEAVQVGRATGMPIHINDLRLAMRSLWGEARGVLSRLDDARGAGVDVTVDVAPYTYWEGPMTELFPVGMARDTEAAVFALQELAPPARLEIQRYPLYPTYQGHTLAEVSAMRGQDPAGALLQLIADAQDAHTPDRILARGMDTTDVVTLVGWPYASVATDGGLDDTHPRAVGAFTRVLGPWVRGGRLTLEQAVHKMTGGPAQAMGIADRGVVRAGAYADLVLFDPATVGDHATPDHPRTLSTGIKHVWVNGAEVYSGEGRTTGARPGEIVVRASMGGSNTGGGGAGAPSSRASDGETAGLGRSAPSRAPVSARPGRRGAEGGRGEWGRPGGAGGVVADAVAGAAWGAARGVARVVDSRAVDSVFAAYDRSDAPGCAVGVMVDGRLAYAKGYGMADLEHGLAITPTSVFRVGSVSKQFTAAVMVLLAQDGVLSLDDRVQKWIPELPDYGPRFTIRRLLHHTSGVRDYLVLMDLAGKRGDDYYTDDEVVAMLARQPVTNFDPGAEFLYSNSGYFLLSQIVKRATGRSMIDVAREKLFGPLGMTHTRFYADHTRIVPNRAMGYAPAPTEEETPEAGAPREPAQTTDRRGSIPWRISMTTLPMIGDGGIFTTVEDLAKWDRNFDDPAVGGPAFVAAMLERGVLNDGDTIPYALGLEHGTQRGLRTVEHGGAFVGFRAATLRYPDQHTSVYTLCNRADANPTALSHQVGAALLGDVMAPPAATRERAARARERVDTLALPVAKLRQYVGHYHSDVLDTTYRIRLRGDTLTLQVGNYLDGPMAAVGEDTFQRGELRLHFLRTHGFGFEVDAGRVRGVGFERVGSP